MPTVPTFCYKTVAPPKPLYPVSFSETLDLAVFSDFCRAMLCISTAIAVMRCPSVRPSVTFVDHVKTNKDVLEFFFTIG